MKAYAGSIATLIKLGGRWRRIVNFTPRLLYPRRRSPRYALHWRLDRPQNRSVSFSEEKYVLPRLGFEPRIIKLDV
jgi:hypothetical protein